MLRLRFRLLLPLIIVLAAWLPYRALSAGAPLTAFEVLVTCIAVLLVTAINLEIVLLQPLRRLRRAMDELRSGAATQPRAAGPWPPVGALPLLTSSVQQLREQMRDNEARLAHETSERQKLERAVHELEERYMLTVDRASDGTWEWDLKTQKVRFSPRWQGMLGQPVAALDHIDDWRALLHPDDRDALRVRLEAHLRGDTPHFDAEFRMRHRSGEHRWLHSRGTAIRHASGKPYRMVFIDNDIHQRKTLEGALIEAAEGLSALSAIDFFEALSRSLSSILGTRDNVVCYLVGEPPTRARTLAYFQKNRLVDNIEYELEGTSCGAVVERGEIVYVPSGVCDIWPRERQYDRDSYIGVPMFDSNGKIIGHFACMDGKPMRQDLPHLALFKIFSVRAAAELERLLLSGQLDRL